VAVLPSLVEQQDRVVPIAPYLTVDMPMAVPGEQAASADEQIRLIREQIRQGAVITQHDPSAPRIFGMMAFAPTETLQSVCRTWMDIAKSPNADWFEACCDHMASVALRRDFTPQWSKIRRPNEDQTFVPLVTRMTEVPRTGRISFEIIFAALPDPRDVPVISKMLKGEEFYYKVLKSGNGSRIKLINLISELDSEGKNRVPVLNEAGVVLYIVHRSLIERFLAGLVIEKEVGSSNRTDKAASELTLADMLDNAEMERTMRTTFAVVGPSASLRDAGEAMQQIAECRDVFVTENGGRDGRVLGWLTNIDLARAVI
jgi:CBS domain-containing protein